MDDDIPDNKATERSCQGVRLAAIACAILLAAGCNDAANQPKQPVVSAASPAANVATTTSAAPLGSSSSRNPLHSSAKESAAPVEPGPIQFRDITRESGVKFRHTDGSSGKLYIIETVASGMVTFDYDNDGLVDIYFTNGAPLAGTPQPPEPPRNRLFRNLGGLRFADVTEAAGVGDTGYGLGVVAGDYNEDGLADLYVSNFGRNALYHNNGDGSFTDVATPAGVAVDDPKKLGAGVAFLDIEADGDLDLLVANYIRYSYDIHVNHTWLGVPIYSGPLQYPFHPSMLFRNEGNGTFSDISEDSGIGGPQGHGMGVIAADVDQDGDSDIVVNNDGAPGNFMFRNDGKGRFTEVAGESGTAFNAGGLALGSMGVDCGDTNNDGLIDLYITVYQKQVSTLFRNVGDGLFEDVTKRTGAGNGTYNRVTWGCGLVDLDNDGWRDIFLTCGHLIDNVDTVDDSTTYAQAPIILRNSAGSKFTNVTASCGDALEQPLVGRGAAFDDLDNDGDIDAVILNSRRDAVVLANESPSGGHWLQLQLVGTGGARDAAGARVKVVAGDLVQVSQVHRGRGYQGHFGSRLHFGLAGHTQVDRIEVTWLGGGTDVLENLTAGRIVTLLEGSTRLEQ